MAGPNRPILFGGHLPEVSTTAPPCLGKIAQVDFGTLPTLELKIITAFDRALRRQNALLLSPSIVKVKRFLDGLEAGIMQARKDLADPWPDIPGQQILQLKGAVAELLAQNGDTLSSLNWAIDLVAEALAALDRQVTSAQAALEYFSLGGGFDLSQDKRVPDNFIVELRAILERNGLDARIGAKSLLVQLIVELTGTRPDDPWAEVRYAKTVADKVRKIVKAHQADR